MAAAAPDIYSGKCFCGAAAFTARGLRDIWFCHCIQCRALTGHYMAAARAPVADVEISGDIRWTRVSENSAHGFCAECSSPLFWRNETQDTISVVASSLSTTKGLEPKGHVYVAEKGDYYDIADGLRQYETYPEGGV